VNLYPEQISYSTANSKEASKGIYDLLDERIKNIEKELFDSLKNLTIYFIKFIDFVM
jgi:hypothetical protein